MRLVPEMDEAGTFLWADDRSAEPVPNAENLIRARWCAYRSQVEGREVTVVMFDHPANRRSPTRWFTMVTPFAYLAATLGLPDDPLELAASETLTLVYGVAVADATLSSEAVERLYRAWLSENRLAE